VDGEDNSWGYIDCVAIPSCEEDEYRPFSGTPNENGFVDCIDIPPCEDEEYRPLNGGTNDDGYVSCIEIPPCDDPDQEYRPEDGTLDETGLTICEERCPITGLSWNVELEVCDDSCSKEDYFFDETYSNYDGDDEIKPYSCTDYCKCDGMRICVELYDGFYNLGHWCQGRARVE